MLDFEGQRIRLTDHYQTILREAENDGKARRARQVEQKGMLHEPLSVQAKLRKRLSATMPLRIATKLLAAIIIES